MWPEASKPVIVPAVKRLMNGENNISHPFKSNLQGQDPIPTSGGASAIDCKHYYSNLCQCSWRSHTAHGENIFGRPETICLWNTDGKPYEAQEKVKHDDKDRKTEDSWVESGWKVVNCHCDDKQAFWNGPNESTPFDIVVRGPSGKVDFPDSKLWNDVVCSRLI